MLELCCGTSVSGLSVLPLQLLHRVHIGIGVCSASLRPAPSGLGCRLIASDMALALQHKGCARIDILSSQLGASRVPPLVI